MPQPECPICRRPVRPADANRSFPFCSPRCKLIDLGRWLDGRYVIPGEPLGPNDDPSDPAR